MPLRVSCRVCTCRLVVVVRGGRGGGDGVQTDRRVLLDVLHGGLATESPLEVALPGLDLCLDRRDVHVHGTSTKPNKTSSRHGHMTQLALAHASSSSP